MRILFTGDYDLTYNRTTIIREGLTKLGHQIVELPFKKRSRENQKKILVEADNCDFIFMPSFTHREVGYVRKTVGKKKFIVFDPLISRYLTKVHDYKLVTKWGLSALRNYLRDLLSMQYADLVLTDTKAHLGYFHSTFRIPLTKMDTLYIGNNFSDYYPSTNKRITDSIFRVGFYGGFIPLQGIMNILEAAEILHEQSDVRFDLIGTGFEYEKAKKFVAQKKLSNINMPGWVNFPDLRERIQQFDLALGIFGDTKKSDLVIPNKLFHYAACARPIITKDSPAVREIFADKEDLILTSCHPKDIAEQIAKLKNDYNKRESIGQNIYKKLLENYSEVQVATKLIELYKRHL
ncbi:MAG: hypothetical protein A2Z20_11970 [Bdellovibrionales bacterium RBG_16_40_8]|nr:MAG: hypothetical protein A2Z20_11970 [Bdellovibrionales bacterium RBG_16_40_8]